MAGGRLSPFNQYFFAAAHLLEYRYVSIYSPEDVYWASWAYLVSCAHWGLSKENAECVSRWPISDVSKINNWFAVLLWGLNGYGEVYLVAPFVCASLDGQGIGECFFGCGVLF